MKKAAHEKPPRIHTRDTPLPKLLSGELRVKDADAASSPHAPQRAATP